VQGAAAHIGNADELRAERGKSLNKIFAEVC